LNESLLPTRNVLQGGEVLRVVGTDGRPLRVPLAALLDIAEARFATRAAEASSVKGLWDAVNSLTGRVAALEDLWDASASFADDLRPELDALAARVKALEAQIKTKKDK
jgi:hypothetical protein